MKVIFASSTADLRNYTASACMEQASSNNNQNILISVAHLDSTNYDPENLTLTTLESLGILNHKTTMTFLTKEDINSSLVIAMDHTTRNQIQKEFGKLVPLFNEVSNNESIDIEKISPIFLSIKRLYEEESHHHVISMIHHIHGKTPSILKNLHKFS